MHLYLAPQYQCGEEARIQSFLNEGGCFVDVGSNIGNIAISAAIQVGPTGNIVSREPHSEICKFQQQNLALNNLENVQLLNVTVGEREGVSRFSNKGADDQSHVISSGGIRVPMSTLDSLLAGLNRINLLKIDTEGFEKFVLSGVDTTTLERYFRLPRRCCVSKSVLA